MFGIFYANTPSFSNYHIQPISKSTIFLIPCTSSRIWHLVFGNRYVNFKAVDSTTLDGTHVMAMEVVCMVEENFSWTILTNQLHLIAHLVNDAYTLDVLPRALHEDLERLYEAKCKAQRKHGRGLVNTKVFCIYFWISWPSD